MAALRATAKTIFQTRETLWTAQDALDTHRQRARDYIILAIENNRYM